MSKNGPQFYDNPEVFEFYAKHRSSGVAPNENIEQPILWDLIGDPDGLSVLDLGCGDARISKKFQELGAKSYLGLEGSKLMAEKAEKNLTKGFSEIQCLDLENWKPEAEQYDLAISSLAFHYLENLEGLFKKINKSLKPNGRLIFSVEHPVITSCDVSLEKSSLREAWIVDNYFSRGPRTVDWMGDVVTKYHRTIADYLDLVPATGFSLIQLKESDPPKLYFQDEALWQRRRRIPLFLFISASKKPESTAAMSWPKA